MPDSSIKLDAREFNETLRRYAAVSKRTFPDIVNKKALFIARRAIKETPKADKLKIGKSLSEMIYDFTGKRKKLTMRNTFGGQGQSIPAPVAALLINWKRGQQGKPGFYGDKMAKAIKSLISRRQNSVAWLKSGWIPAVKKLGALVSGAGAASVDPAARKFKNPQGDATPATSNLFSTKATITNSAGAKDKDDPLKKIGLPALQRAVDYETAQMAGEVERRMRDDARGVGITTA